MRLNQPDSPEEKALPIAWHDCTWDIEVIVNAGSRRRKETLLNAECGMWSAELNQRLNTSSPTISTFTFHVSRFTSMKTPRRSRRAFTLIELLVVIAIIAILA